MLETYTKNLQEKDPFANKKEIKEEAFKEMLEISERNARIGSEMDEIEFKYNRKNDYCDNEEDYQLMIDYYKRNEPNR